MSVPAEEISEARADFEAELLPDEATILRPVEESDGGGGHAVTEWQVRETVAARLDPKGRTTSADGGETRTHPGDRLETRIPHIVSVPAGTDLELGDRIEVNGSTYEVNVMREHGNWELLLRAEIREVF